MAESLMLNNGNQFTVTDIVMDRATYADYSPGAAFGLAPGAPPASYIDASAYINDSWEVEFNADHPYGWINNLKQRKTKSEHQTYLNMALNNGVFIWGNYQNGGLYLCKRNSTPLYDLYVWCGYGEDIADPDYDIYYIKDYPTTQGLTAEQLTFVSILHTIRDSSGNDVDSYCVFFGGVEITDGVATSYWVAADRQYDNPLNPDQCTTAPYNIIGAAPQFIADLITVNTQYVVNPMNPLIPNFQTPEYMVIESANSDTYINRSQDIGYRGYSDDPAYRQQGSWWGGDGNKVPEDPNNGTTNSTGGGYGTPDQTSIPCGGTGEHQYDVDGTTAGFFTIYHCSESDMQAFNSWLFSKMLNPDALWSTIWDNVMKVFAQPTELILGALAIKHNPVQKASSQEIKFCGIGTEIFVETVTQYTTLDMGSIEIDEQYASFLDYSGYSETYIYLPFIGFQQLEQNRIMGSTLHLIYQIDNLTGSCIAQLTVTRPKRNYLSKTDDTAIDSQVYTFTGNCVQQLPITATDWQQAITSAINIVGQAVSGVSSGNPATAASAGLNVLKEAMNLKPTITHASSTTSSFGMMNCLYPYLLLMRPIRAIPEKLAQLYGYRCSKSTYIKECRGYTKVMDAKNLCDDIRCTDEEKNEIEQLLLKGIYV